MLSLLRLRVRLRSFGKQNQNVHREVRRIGKKLLGLAFKTIKKNTCNRNNHRKDSPKRKKQKWQHAGGAIKKKKGDNPVRGVPESPEAP